MSMISEQVDRLRKVAQVERDLGRHEFEQVLLDAADTIWELSGRLTHWELHECPGCKNVADLQEALAENAKLRELVDYMTPIALYGASEQERDRMRELGIEVD